MKLQKLLKRVRTSDRRKAISALSALEERISPQGVAFMEEAVTAIPVLLDTATRPETSIRPEILVYLGDAYAYTLGTWQFRCEDEPASRHHFTKMVSWEKSISQSYRDSIPSVLNLLGADNSEAVRSSAAYLLSRIKESGPELIPTLRRMYDEQVGEPTKIDIIEAVAHLAITLRLGNASDVQWLRERPHELSPAIRLGGALSLMARQDEDERKSLERIAVDARPEGEAALQQAAWMANKSTGWALERIAR
ncbi:hypothetical protein [Actinacidiphila acididurans]|uniref:HEAT repeat domain-containing protein n=1 Tax=Actinacidiphila acididurans TaxID=2784346 RepID=A0ABS2TRL9_9ACTN|nr:hypothetical protein [Actinacidiphila acididurans]MBM9505978.1 hypothetical protein [Actinacidiphila acididurans]